MERHLWQSEQCPREPLSEKKKDDGQCCYPLPGWVPGPLIMTCYILLAAKLRRSHLTQSRKPLNIHLVLILIFYLCWLPYHVFYFLQVSGDALHSVMKKSLDMGILFADGLLYFNSCLPPIVFLSMGQEFMGCRENACNYQNAVPLEGEPAE